MDISTLIKSCFWILSIGAVMFKGMKYLRGSRHKSREFTMLQMRYFIGYFGIQFPLCLTSPFTNILYMDSNVQPSQIAYLRTNQYIVASLMSLIVGSILSRLGHARSIIISRTVFALSALSRWMGGYTCFMIAVVLVGLASPLSQVAFDDWIIAEMQAAKNLPPEAEVQFAENRAMLNLLISILSSNVGDWVRNFYDTKSVFLVAAVTMFVSLIPLLLVLGTVKGPVKVEKAKSAAGGFVKAIKAITSPGNLSLKLLVIVDVCLSLCNFLFVPTICQNFKNVENLPAARLVGSYDIADLWGTQLLQIIPEPEPRKVLALSYGLQGLCFVMMNILYDYKGVLYALVVAIGTWRGTIQPPLLKLRRQLFPDDIRVYLISIVRLVSSVGSGFLVNALKNYEQRSQLLIIGSVPILGASLLVIMILSRMSHGKSHVD